MKPVTAMIHIGHVVDVLRTMPADSVHCVVTSPPYWGLRVYGTEPQVWDADPGCEHDWRIVVKPAANGMVFSEMQDRREGGSLNEMSATRRPNESAFCAKCSAWRGDLGLEPSFNLYVHHIVQVFREVRRVLRPDGTLWLNMGDCYVASPRGNTPGDYSTSSLTNPECQDKVLRSARTPQAFGLKEKDLVGMDWAVAFALRDDGWWLRARVVWAKGVSFLRGYSGSVMPESTDDRPTRAYETVFLLTKSVRYFYDADAIREPSVSADEAKWDPGTDGLSGEHRNTGRSTRRFAVGGPDPEATPDGKPHSRMRRDAGRDELGLRTAERFGHGPGWRARQKTAEDPPAGGRRQAPEPGEPNAFHPLGRNVRDVWVINPEPFDYAMCRACKRVYDGREYGMLADAPRDGDGPPKKICRCGRSDEWLSHFAVFPQALVLPCVLAGTSERGCCPQCGAPWKRVVEAEGGTIGAGWHDHTQDDLVGQRVIDQVRSHGRNGTVPYKRVETGWRPACSCGVEGDGSRATVLDPFAGSGTTLLAAAKNGRNGVGIELQEDYVPIIRRRLAGMETDLIHPTTVEVVCASPA